MRRRTTTLVRASAFVALAFLLSACIKLDINLSVASDNTVSGSVIFALNKELIQLSGQSADDLLGSSAPVPSDIPGVKSEPYEDNEFQGERITFDSVPLTRFNQSNGSTDQLRIERQGDTFVVSGAFDLTSAAGLSGATGASGLSGATGASGLSGGSTGASGATGASSFPGAGEILKTAQLKITLSFPGPVKSSNGTIDGNTVTWTPKFGERLELRATASAVGSGSSSTTTILIIVAAAVVVAAIVIGIVLSRRRRPAVATAEVVPMTGEPGPPPGAAPAAPPPPGATPPLATPPPPPPPSEPEP